MTLRKAIGGRKGSMRAFEGYHDLREAKDPTETTKGFRTTAGISLTWETQRNN